jgi:hypothetical protein
MILKENNIDTVIIGDTKAKQFRVSDSKIIYDILRNKLYKDPIAAICREIASNSRDANREVGNTDPITIEIIDGSTSAVGISGDMAIAFHDGGPGITPDRMDDIFIIYGESSKRDTNKLTGAYGLGAKTPFAYSDTFSIKTVCDYNGKRMKYSYVAAIDKDEKGTMYLFGEEPTTENTGTVITVPIKKSDRHRFEEAALNYTLAWDIPPILKNISTIAKPSVESFEFPEFEIYFESENRQLLFTNCQNTVILIDGIPYPVPREVNSPACRPGKLVVSFENGVFDLSGGREDIQSTKENLQILRDKFRSIQKYAAKWVSDFVDDAKTPYQAAFRFFILKKSTSTNVKVPVLATSMYNIMTNGESLPLMWKGKNLNDLVKINVESLNTVKFYCHTKDSFNRMERKTTISYGSGTGNKFFENLFCWRYDVRPESAHAQKQNEKHNAYVLDSCSASTQRLYTILKDGNKTDSAILVKRSTLDEYMNYNGYSSLDPNNVKKMSKQYEMIFAEETKLLEEFCTLNNISSVAPTPYGKASKKKEDQNVEIRYRQYVISNSSSDKSKPSIYVHDHSPLKNPKKDKKEFSDHIVLQAQSVSENHSSNVSMDLVRFLLGITAGTKFYVCAAARSYNTMRKMGAKTPEEYLSGLSDKDIDRIKKTYTWSKLPKGLLQMIAFKDKFKFDATDTKKIEESFDLSTISEYSVNTAYEIGRAIRYGDLPHIQKEASVVQCARLKKPTEEDVKNATHIFDRYPMLSVLCETLNEEGNFKLTETEIKTINDYLKMVQNGKK